MCRVSSPRCGASFRVSSYVGADRLNRGSAVTPPKIARVIVKIQFIVQILLALVVERMAIDQ